CRRVVVIVERIQDLGCEDLSQSFVSASHGGQEDRIHAMSLGVARVELERALVLAVGLRPVPVAVKPYGGECGVGMSQSLIESNSPERIVAGFRHRLARWDTDVVPV